MSPLCKIILVIFIFSIASAFSCARQNVNQLAEAEKSAQGASKAVSGDVIKTAEDTGKPEEKKPDKPVSAVPKEGEKPEPPPPILPGASPKVPPVTPIEGKITMKALVYPIYNPVTGKYDKPDIGDVPTFSNMTPDPVPTVVAYYEQLLKGRDYQVRQNIGERPGALFGEFTVNDSGTHWNINIRGGPSSATSILLRKGQ